MSDGTAIAQGRALIRRVRERLLDLAVELDDFQRTVKADVREAVWPSEELTGIKGDLEEGSQHLREVLAAGSPSKCAWRENLSYTSAQALGRTSYSAGPAGI